MAVMLIHRRKFVDYFLLDVVRRDNNGLLHASAPPSILNVLLVVLLEPHVLVELSEGKRKSRKVFKLSEISI
jgi:hypothetical protein